MLLLDVASRSVFVMERRGALCVCGGGGVVRTVEDRGSMSARGLVVLQVLRFEARKSFVTFFCSVRTEQPDSHWTNLRTILCRDTEIFRPQQVTAAELRSPIKETRCLATL